LTWIKICGITNLEDAKTAVDLGADALGFIFAPSKRRVEPEKAREICKGLPERIEKIGVFVDRDLNEVKEIAALCKLTGLQFHGKETSEYCREFNKAYMVIKAFRVDGKKGWGEIPAYIRAKVVHRILLDTYVQGMSGGTGRTFPWTLVKGKDWGNIPVIIAGGINPSNAAEAIREACPFGIDVGSGVEREPGQNDREKLKKLICGVKNFYKQQP
jgi:phosphoribosylanthranilate isomerase